MSRNGRAQFVSSGGVEKIVATAGFYDLRRTDKITVRTQGTEWLFPGKTSCRHHILVKSQADVLYLGGHTGGRGTGNWSGAGVSISPTGTGGMNPRDHWKLEAGTQELEWLILIACWGLEDGVPVTNWSTAIPDLRIRGMLGFHGRGWSGTREGVTFLLFNQVHSVGHIDGMEEENGKTVIRLREEEENGLANGYKGKERQKYKTFSPGDSVQIGEDEAVIQDVEVSAVPTRRILLDRLIGQHGSGTPVSATDKNIPRAWRIAWGGVARDVTNYINKPTAGAVPCAYLVHPDAIDETFETCNGSDPVDYSVLKYQAVKGIGMQFAKPGSPWVWEYIEKDISP